MMKKLTKVMAVAVSATMLCAAPVYAADTLTFGTNPEFPPFEFITSEGVIDTFDGIDMAIAKQIAEENDMEVKMESMEFDSLLVALQNGQVDAVIAGMTVTDERKEAVDFSTPYYTATQVMIVKEDSDIEKAEDMADKKICVIQGYTGETCVNEMGYDYEAFKKGTEAVMELVNGKCDVVVIDSATAKQYVDDNEGLKIVEDPDAFASEEYAIAVQKGNTELLDKINTAIDKMLEDGTISELAAQYAEEDMEEAVEEEAADGEADTEEATEEDTTEDAAEEDTAEEEADAE
ncbi:MAG: basic amino acid ABC transporter substrate-binding protein [Eubacteriales bacterium]|nr:basic amino acid ABC transporter substrate-binding protein [Eubacteriales bacterium]